HRRLPRRPRPRGARLGPRRERRDAGQLLGAAAAASPGAGAAAPRHGAVRIAALALAAGIALGAREGGAAEPDPGYFTDAAGRRMRVDFDPGRRAFLGSAHAPIVDAGGLSAERIGLEGGISFRHAVDFADEGVRWKLQHDFALASVGLGRPDTTVRGELYALRFLRWSADGSVVVPTTPPRRFGFPFGVGFDAAVGRVDLHAGTAAQGEIGIARGALLLDLLPHRALGTYAIVGVGPRYDLRVDGADRTVEHVVVPFSEPEVALHLESANGRHVLWARAGGGYAWTSGHGAGAQAGASLSYEAVVLAVNDLPLSVGAAVRWRWD